MQCLYITPGRLHQWHAPQFLMEPLSHWRPRMTHKSQEFLVAPELAGVVSKLKLEWYLTRNIMFFATNRLYVEYVLYNQAWPAIGRVRGSYFIFLASDWPSCWLINSICIISVKNQWISSQNLEEQVGNHFCWPFREVMCLMELSSTDTSIPWVPESPLPLDALLWRRQKRGRNDSGSGALWGLPMTSTIKLRIIVVYCVWLNSLD